MAPPTTRDSGRGRRKNHGRRGGSVLVLAGVIVSVVGCGGGGASSPSVNAQVMGVTYCAQPLETVPETALGTGKVVFNRYDFAVPGHREGLYVIDTASHRTSCRSDVAVSPVVSPDGTRLAYTRNAGMQTMYDVYVSNLDGSGEEHVSDFPTQEGAPAWTSDGSAVVYAGATADWIYNLYWQPAHGGSDGSRVEITTYAAPCALVCSPFSGGSGHLSVSPAGLVAFSTGQAIATVGMVQTLTTLYAASAATGGASVALHSPAWSSDGTRLAFVAVSWAMSSGQYSERQQLQLFVIEADGSAPTVVATLPASGASEPGVASDPYSVCWTADGLHLVFNVPDGDIQAHLWSVGTDGTEPTQLTNAPGVWDLDASCAP